MRAAPYARISKEDVGNVDNTDIQLDECLAWTTENGHELVGTYVDNNISAYSNARRPDYERLLRDVEANKIDIIVCTELSRLNRNLRNSISLIAQAYTTSLQHIAVTDPERHGFDLSTKSGIQNALEPPSRTRRKSPGSADARSASNGSGLRKASATAALGPSATSLTA